MIFPVMFITEKPASCGSALSTVIHDFETEIAARSAIEAVDRTMERNTVSNVRVIAIRLYGSSR